MAHTVQLKAVNRSTHGTGPARAMRRGGQVPAVIYGRGREPVTLTVDGTELGRLLEKIHPESTIVELAVDGATVKTLIREVQRHPVRPGIVHVDFYEIRAGEKIRLEVPIHCVGIPEGVRNQGGTLDQVIRNVAIEVLPADIPERVELDVTALTIGKSLHVSDLKIPGVHILMDAALTVCTVVAPRIEEVAAPAAAAVEGAPVEGEAAAAAPAEGAAEAAEPELIRKRKPTDEDEEEK
ncbi:MAG TPA: 50S ribosomal protein L25/general stress protein Ctc [Candidatus Methylomirabilis sp.]|nr:50S ribosomal protein L25/general stress protein Ctc [Gemmatimonadales bacterium]HYB42689.1 50S ribosomal protein L25/general stress protein Ctc [Candidatus Methylomirabilis sp.]